MITFYLESINNHIITIEMRIAKLHAGVISQQVITDYFSRCPGFNSQHLYSGSELSATVQKKQHPHTDMQGKLQCE